MRFGSRSAEECSEVVAGLPGLGRRGSRTAIMGVVNATPDSFSDGGREDLLAHVDRLVDDGVDIVDIGGESTRPGAAPIDADTETRRVVPLVEAVRRRHPDLLVSVDTRRACVARDAVAAGAGIVNDVSGGAFDADMLPEVARLPATYVAMHARGIPETMQQLTDYDDVVSDVAVELADVAARTRAAGIAPWRLVLDPGIGFAKTHSQNLLLLRHLPDLKARLGDYPILIGPSRKGFIGALTGEPRPDRRDFGTAAACCVCVPAADIIRVHNVRDIKAAIAVADAVCRGT